MTKRGPSPAMIAAAVLAAAAGIVAFRRRPVKTPERAGTWEPAANDRTRRR